ncbi:hypothetical protein GCM10020220_090150 [Nonomuraea rubra]
MDGMRCTRVPPGHNPGNNPAEPVLALRAIGTQTTLRPGAHPTGRVVVGARLTSHNWFVSETAP